MVLGLSNTFFGSFLPLIGWVFSSLPAIGLISRSLTLLGLYVSSFAHIGARYFSKRLPLIVASFENAASHWRSFIILFFLLNGQIIASLLYRLFLYRSWSHMKISHFTVDLIDNWICLFGFKQWSSRPVWPLWHIITSQVNFSKTLITFLLMHIFPFAVPPVCPAAGAQTLGPVCYPRSELFLNFIWYRYGSRYLLNGIVTMQTFPPTCFPR